MRHIVRSTHREKEKWKYLPKERTKNCISLFSVHGTSATSSMQMELPFRVIISHDFNIRRYPGSMKKKNHVSSCNAILKLFFYENWDEKKICIFFSSLWSSIDWSVTIYFYRISSRFTFNYGEKNVYFCVDFFNWQVKFCLSQHQSEK